MEKKGKLIVFEGSDCCGKGTQMQLTCDWLTKERGCQKVVRCADPGSTTLGTRLREILKDPSVSLMPGADILLFAAARQEMIVEQIGPCLEQGYIVLCDRFYLSTLIYQCFAQSAMNIDQKDTAVSATKIKKTMQSILDIHNLFAKDIHPDLTLVFDINDETYDQRRRTRAGNDDRFENESEESMKFMHFVRAGYRCAWLEPDAWLIQGKILRINANTNVEAVQQQVRSAFNLFI